ncbi:MULTISPECIES: glycoside hydrolase family 3 C-terminal domain-containing protein [unclassified Rhizobium]|jgi:beta-glucosidase|uniref:beta-glucosidase family protein n=1 Tax=unclassified Rhizobium TaxID=2613769 RepID=UPI0006455EF4|nr:MULTISPECIES: glycoside hydrolase family 3 C-terminal domain-containing protein [unclassified Rhizobium]MBN8953628.1 glycoside hydrolase family 3 C-terminal domain-containing protein [Rhizobium tropici]OJY79074.1 MAG: glycosyl hydrolase [Rhizobium sp. 60-20]RKD67808.1 beta-glucosidase [Rhizobium sp. WW_1]
MTWNISDRELGHLVEQMTLEEKVATVSGYGLWRTAANYRLNIPEVLMTDGTYGVRYSIEQIDGPQDSDSQLAAFLGVVNADLSRGVEGAFGSTRPATCFPNGSSFACSWDVDLAHELGEALAAECQAFGVNILLGPGINIRRTPLAGRSYEYYSEDPVVTGEIAAAVINGMQKNGVGASLKHFACNNSEVQRTTMSSVVEERALREIYLAGFERAIRKSNPWTVMSSYNRLNDVQAAENHWLLTEVLRDDWGYDGVVVSDWHGIKDRPASLNAGNDLDMPESGARKQELLDAVEAGRVPMEVLDRSCLRMLKLVRLARNNIKPNATADYKKHHALSQRMAAESIVLLRNEDALLPLDGGKLRKIALVGAAATEPVIQGSGCATTRPTEVDIPLAEIRQMAPGADVSFHAVSDFEAGSSTEAAALAGIDGADVVLFFGNTEVGYDGEGSDRTHLNLHDGQDELIERLSQRNGKLVVVLATPDAVVMPWIDETAAVLAAFFGGQGAGHAVAQVLFGKQNPCGKLTVTFPVQLEDTPGFLTYPGENNRHIYSEGIHAGYRSYDKRKLAPLFPFGFGLSYTSFQYANIAIDTGTIDASSTFKVSFDVTNTGRVPGKEIAQIYVRPHTPRLIRPIRELKGFAKVALQPGESKRVEVTIEARDLRYYDPDHRQWLLDAGDLTIEVAASSRDIRLEKVLRAQAPALPSSILNVESQPYLVLEQELARKRFGTFLKEQLGLDDEETEKMLEYCGGSFLGIYNTVAWVAGDKISKTDMAAFLDSLNREMGMAVGKAA